MAKPPISNYEFIVGADDFSALEIRYSGRGEFHYFFDTVANRLITDFVLRQQPQVDTLCCVTLIKKGGKYTPRLRFWKKDKTKRARVPLEVTVPVTSSTRNVKAQVDTRDAHENLWELVHFLQSFTEVSLPDNNFRVVTADGAELANILRNEDKAVVLEAVRMTVGSSLTEADLRLLSNRKAQLEKFNQLLQDADYFERQCKALGKPGGEAVWQSFFEANPWIFGYGLQFIACEPLNSERLEQITTGANIFTGAGKRSDAVMRSKGYISSLLFCEIKTHRTPLLEDSPYRKPDVYQVSTEVSGGLSQVQKTAHKAVRLISDELRRIYDKGGTPTGIEVSTASPRQVLVVGSLEQFTVSGEINPEKSMSFELYRSSIHDVEIITFDELYERVCFIVRD